MVINVLLLIFISQFINVFCCRIYNITSASAWPSLLCLQILLKPNLKHLHSHSISVWHRRQKDIIYFFLLVATQRAMMNEFSPVYEIRQLFFYVLSSFKRNFYLILSAVWQNVRISSTSWFTFAFAIFWIASLRRLCETWHFLTLSVSEHLCRRSVCVPQGCHGCKEPQILRAALKALNNRPPVGTAASRCKRHTELCSVH